MGIRNQSLHAEISFTDAVDTFRTRTVAVHMEWVTVFEAISIFHAHQMADAVSALHVYAVWNASLTVH